MTLVRALHITSARMKRITAFIEKQKKERSTKTTTPAAVQGR
jgi:hypothetical protein